MRIFPAVIVFFSIFVGDAKGVYMKQERTYEKTINSFSPSDFARAFRFFKNW
jgi:hypothetical protein